MTFARMSRRELLAFLAAGATVPIIGGCSSGANRSGSTPTTRPGRSTSTAAPTTTSVPANPRPPGTLPFADRPEGTESMTEIEHIVVYMQENHSYDSYYGMLGRGDGYTLRGGVPTNSNPRLDGVAVPVFHMDSTCDHTKGASQSWHSTHTSVNGGKMDGFIRAGDGGTGSLGYWNGDDLPFYSSLASTFPLCDRWFGSAPAQTFPNRRFMQAATSVGIVSTDVKEVLATPEAPNGLIWDRLNAHGISWADYVIDLADIFLFPTFYGKNKDHVKGFSQFLTDCSNGTLPQVCFVSPGNKTYTEESPADVRLGEAYSASIINAVMSGKNWEKTAMFFVYDEHGGYYDHVPPPAAIPPDDIAPRVDPEDMPAAFDHYGPRVPGHVISPYAKKNYVSHVVHDHTSILKFIETKFNLGAMTFRDANADDLLDSFDFTKMSFQEPPTLTAPALAATKISTCAPQIAYPPQPAPSR